MVSQMDMTPRSAMRSSLVRAQGKRLGLTRSVAWLGGVLAAAAALAVGALLAVVAATAVAVMVLVAAILFFLTGLAFRARRAADSEPQLLEGRRVGHAWVAYGWDRPVR